MGHLGGGRHLSEPERAVRQLDPQLHGPHLTGAGGELDPADPYDAYREISGEPLVVAGGVAAGAGANIALACDIVVAAKSAKFIQSFAAIGLIPDSGGSCCPS